jgi:hypothetical protein
MAKVNRANEAALSHDVLLALLHYDPITGLFTWRVSRSGVKAGRRAGCRDTNGYVRLGVCGRFYLAHRLAWFYMTGKWPADQVDHEDGVRSNNVWTNLREATNSEQKQNRAPRSSSKSGLLGVTWEKGRNKWRVSIMRDGVSKFIGHFTDPMQAAAAYAKAKAELHTFSPTVRPPNEPVRAGPSV